MGARSSFSSFELGVDVDVPSDLLRTMAEPASVAISITNSH